jgi:hypothetical protein
MKTNLNKRDEVVINLLIDNYEIEVCEPAEPGYSLSENEKAALICDWNRIEEKYPNIYEYIDNNFMLLYSDEWIILEDGKCYRTSPDSYGWQPSIVIDCDQYITSETVNDFSEDEFIDFLDRNSYLNNSKRAINLWGFEPRGLKIDNNYFHLFVHEANPEQVLSELLKNDPAGKYYFVIDAAAQFGLQFSIYKIG